MAILTVHPVNSDQETAIRLFLDALHVKYNTEDETDETAYLKSSSAMIEHLNTAVDQEKRGEGKSITLDDIWK